MSSSKPGLQFPSKVLNATQSDSVTAVILATRDKRAFQYFKKLVGVSGISSFKNKAGAAIEFPSTVSDVTLAGDPTSLFLATEDRAVLPFFEPIIGEWGESDFTYNPTSYSAHDLATGDIPDPSKS